MRVAILVLFACGGPRADDTSSPCRTGWVLEHDGHCYPPEAPPPDLADALAALPPCDPAPQGMPITVSTGCVGDGVCPGATFDTIAEELDEVPECSTASWSAEWVYCGWSAGIEGLFFDGDQDGAPDPDAGNDRVRLYWPHQGRTEDGVGIGASPSCLIESLGTPNRFVVVDVGGTLQFQELVYDRYGLTAYDVGADDGSGQPNGAIDNLYLYGQPE
ncbi:MAG: hypothetical protein ACI8PZ_006095 [Myxococcota bacterium]|jgi:hypothetical protein